jgi:hypothetical protein
MTSLNTCKYLTLYPGAKIGQTIIPPDDLLELIINLDDNINRLWPPYFKDNKWWIPDDNFKKGYIKHLLAIYQSIYTSPEP